MSVCVHTHLKYVCTHIQHIAPRAMTNKTTQDKTNHMTNAQSIDVWSCSSVTWHTVKLFFYIRIYSKKKTINCIIITTGISNSLVFMVQYSVLCMTVGNYSCTWLQCSTPQPCGFSRARWCPCHQVTGIVHLCYNHRITNVHVVCWLKCHDTIHDYMLQDTTYMKIQNTQNSLMPIKVLNMLRVRHEEVNRKGHREASQSSGNFCM